MGERNTEEFERRAGTLLQDSAERLDGRTRSRLTQARHAAIEAMNTRERRVWQWLAPLAGATATAVVAAILLINPARQHVEPTAALAADELELMTSEDSLDFYRDVEFYAWLDTVLEEAPGDGV